MRHRYLHSALGGALAAAVALGCAEPDSRAQQPGVGGARSSATAGGADCADTAEAGALRCAGGRVRREGDRLVVARGGGGPPVVLQDDTTEGARFVRHAYRAHLASIGAHLVELRHYEGSSYLLIDARSGAATPLSGPPVVSPDGRRFVTTSMDLEAGYDPNEIEIWRVTDSVRQLEFSHRPDGWGPSDAVWRDTATIELRKHEMAPDGSSSRVTPLRLTRDGTTWSLHDLSR